MSNSKLQVIAGLGITGLSVARFLVRQGYEVAVTDTREEPPHLAALTAIAPGITTSFGKLDESLLARAARIILSPGIALATPVMQQQVRNNKNIIGDIELFAQHVNKPIIAITGTNAKSTVTTLVGKMAANSGLNVKVGGNLGVPALDLIDSNADVYVLELSSFQLETTASLNAAVASLLNVTPDHMDRYKTFADYQAAKLRVYNNAKLAVCNLDDPLTQTEQIANKLFFTLGKPGRKQFGIAGQHYLAYENQALLDLADLPIEGKHYHANALAALAIGHGFGLQFPAMLEVLKKFKGLPHRCQLIRKRREVKWYNDSKGTNVGATSAAMIGLGEAIDGKLILIAGGLGKNADFSPLKPALEKYTRHVVLLGAAAQEIAAVIDKKIPVSFANSMAEAVQLASEQAHAKDCVLLSPACASYDMYKNFEHRGDVYVEQVMLLED